ncbi:hypothetical protein WJX73_005217 [Symbiochloris irregularis]|uniref:Uncharacterized protein n=1 Tax=Symbiochloris irregularis TaxID=706552 RepID=A0AAW1NMY8_9CHLO
MSRLPTSGALTRWLQRPLVHCQPVLSSVLTKVHFYAGAFWTLQRPSHAVPLTLLLKRASSPRLSAFYVVRAAPNAPAKVANSHSTGPARR